MFLQGVKCSLLNMGHTSISMDSVDKYSPMVYYISESLYKILEKK